MFKEEIFFNKKNHLIDLVPGAQDFANIIKVIKVSEIQKNAEKNEEDGIHYYG